MNPVYVNPQYADTANPSPLHPIHAGELPWQHLLTNIRPSASIRLSFIGSLYIFLGLVSIGAELELLFDLNVSYFGCFINGVSLIIVGIITLVLCRQQVYVLTSQFILVIIQMIITIVTFGFYGYFLYGNFYDLAHCFDPGSIFDCDHVAKITIILGVDIIHLFLTFCLIIVNLIMIRNVRRPAITPETTNYVVYSPQIQQQPVMYPNPTNIN